MFTRVLRREWRLAARTGRAGRKALCLLALLTAAGSAFAGQACLYSEANYRGTKYCFDAGAMRDLSAPFDVKSVSVAEDTEVVVATGPQLRGQVFRYRNNVEHPRLGDTSMPAIRSVQVNPRACFYEDSVYRGRSVCFAPGALEPVLSASLDRMTSSIRVPDGLAAYVFTEPDGKGELLFRYADAHWLWSSNDKSRSLQVLRRKLNCSIDCPIAFSQAYNLFDVVTDATRDASGGRHPLSQAVMTIEMDPRQQFSVDAGYALSIEFKGDRVRMIDQNTQRDIADLRLNDSTAYVSIALDYDARDHLDAQLIESDRARRYLNATPIATISRSTGMPGYTLAMDNEADQAVLMKSLSFARVKPTARVQPVTGCWDRPVLSVAAYFLGQCADGSPGLAAGDPTAIVHSAGAPPNLMYTTPRRRLPTTSRPETTLASFAARDRNPMALYAASRVCGKDIDHIVPSRKRRGIENPSRCVERTMTIITLYQLLFGPQWNQEDFDQVIFSILVHGTTGYATSQPDLERQLIEAVRQRQDNLDWETRHTSAREAWHAANQLFGVSRNGTLDPEAAGACVAGNPALAPQSPAAPTSIAEAREAPLGHYRIDLRNFRPQQVVPRIRTNGRWLASLNPFRIEFLNANDSWARNRLATILGGWSDRYRQYMGNNRLPPGQVSLANTGRSMSENILASISHGTSAHYALITYTGMPLTIIEGSIREDDRSRADIDTVVSAPEPVVFAGSDGAVRGGASFGLQSYLSFLQHQGVTEVSTLAITMPSALVKQRAGFQLVAPLDASDSSAESDGSCSSDRR